MPRLGFKGPHTQESKEKISSKLKGKRPGGFNLKVECEYCKTDIAKPNLKRHQIACKRLHECRHVFAKNTTLKSLKHFNNCLKSSYGIDIYQYVKMFDEQNGKCKICNINNPKTLCIDHCHLTNKVRGLLCNKCNLSIGLFSDDVSILKKAILYLESHDPYKD